MVLMSELHAIASDATLNAAPVLARSVLDMAAAALERVRARKGLKLAIKSFHGASVDGVDVLRAAIQRADALGVSPQILAPARSALTKNHRAAELDPACHMATRMSRAHAGVRKMRVLDGEPAAGSIAADWTPLDSCHKESSERSQDSGPERSGKRRRLETLGLEPADPKELVVEASLKPERGRKLRVEPGCVISFGPSPSSERQTTRPLRLINTSGSRAAFKVKLTHREFYLVVPRCCGTLFPGEARDLQIALKPNWRSIGPGSRRLVVLEMAVGPEEEVPRKAWRYMRERVKEHRLRIEVGVKTSLR